MPAQVAVAASPPRPLRKDPADTVAVALDWSDWIEAEGLSGNVTAAWSQAELLPDGTLGNTTDLTLSGAALAGNVAQTLCAGGTLGKAYRLTCQLTVAGVTQSESVPVEIVER